MDDEAYLYLTTRGWKSGREHEIEIWYTELEGRYYLISEGGERSHWVQNIRREPKITFRVGEKAFRGTARVLDPQLEPELHAAVRALSEAKYGWESKWVVELKPDARGTGE